MEKIRCLLVDDEPLALALLRKHLSQLDFMEVAGTCPDAVGALDSLQRLDIDLLFLDIRMPRMSGLDFLKTLRHPPKTIITTAYREYALDGYDLDIVDYLLKPITFERLFKAIERYLRSSRTAVSSTTPVTEGSYVYIKSGYRHLKIPVREILFMESVKDYIKVHTVEKAIVAKYKIGDAEKDLAEKGFLRVHRSFIVNPINITAYTATDIELGDKSVPIGEKYREYVLRALSDSR